MPKQAAGLFCLRVKADRRFCSLAWVWLGALTALVQGVKRLIDFFADYEKADFAKKIMVYLPVFLVVEAILAFAVGYFLKLLFWLLRG